ncbi:hypothetical protein EYZ11_001772 [Aspergillus tanneri]|nr:hypothetical protein EYZ11_001772 [Aspergillus tanneri]
MQWCNSTHTYLSRNERTDNIWRYRAPEEALSHPFLMHGILSLSALHLARMKDDHRSPAYLDTAVAHQNQALAIFRELLGGINESNAKAMFAFAGVVVMYALGFPHPPEPKDPWACVDELIQVFVLARGTQQVLHKAVPSIVGSEWETILKLDDYNNSLPDSARQVIERLHEINNHYGAQDPTHNTAIYHHTIDILADMIAAIYGGWISVTVACRWAIRLKPEFVDMVRDRSPLALVILTHYCAVLYDLRECWYVGEWSIRVPKAIWQILDDNWKLLVRGPMEAIFGDSFSFENGQIELG